MRHSRKGYGATLENQGVRVWWDREAMESRGLTFLQEIRDTIASVEPLLLIVGPRARHKPYVEVEWRHALREGVIVTPLLVWATMTTFRRRCVHCTARTCVKPCLRRVPSKESATLLLRRFHGSDRSSVCRACRRRTWSGRDGWTLCEHAC